MEIVEIIDCSIVALFQTRMAPHKWLALDCYTRYWCHFGDCGDFYDN